MSESRFGLVPKNSCHSPSENVYEGDVLTPPIVVNSLSLSHWLSTPTLSVLKDGGLFSNRTPCEQQLTRQVFSVGQFSGSHFSLAPQGLKGDQPHLYVNPGYC